MRHLKRGRKLNRTPSHRRAMLRNMVASLFMHGRIVTTPAKAKEARPFAEKLITLAKKDTLHARRRAISILNNPSIVSSLFSEIGPRYKDRPGGYCRILHLAKTRVGDSAPQVLFELVEAEMTTDSSKADAPATAVVPEEANVAADDSADASEEASTETTTPAVSEAAAEEKDDAKDDEA